MRKFAHVNGSPGLVRGIFVDVEAWPKWMPGVHRMEVLERADDRIRAVIEQTLRGRSARQVMEFRLSEDGMRQVQLEGWFKKWDASWRFLKPPNGEGTTVALSVDLDLGLVGLLSPRSLVDSIIDDLFREVVGAARRRSEELLRARVTEGDAGAGETLLEVYEVPGGLDVFWAGRRFTLRDG